MNEDDQGIDALYAAWRDAFRRQDIDTIIGLLTADYVLFAPGLPPQRTDALRPRLEAAFAAYEIDIDFEREERIVSGDLAFEYGWDVQTVRPRDGGEMRRQRQRVFLILRRGPDAVWRFARGMSLPPVSG
ncbi:MAG TPA: DUF4440 domain-containing protein [Thermoanaerobaculia bacterium]|jgi:uncharacterized protein (TIGR02246 family)|nr:DUF4440 domain-containing protein [Thermoanaerobaculia bacterium]